MGGAVVGRKFISCRLAFELVEQTVQVLPVVDHTAALTHADEPRAPFVVKRAPLDSDIGDCFGVRQPTFHQGAGSHGASLRITPQDLTAHAVVG